LNVKKKKRNELVIYKINVEKSLNNISFTKYLMFLWVEYFFYVFVTYGKTYSIKTARVENNITTEIDIEVHK